MIARIFEPLGAFIWHGFQRSGAILHLGAHALLQSPSALRQRHRLLSQHQHPQSQTGAARMSVS